MKDISTGEIVAYKAARHLTMPIVLDTITNLKNVIKDNKIIQSMSRKEKCIDNAPMESFFRHFKDELDYKNCKTFNELVEKKDKYMYYYNNERYQWSRNKMTPVQYRSHLLLVS